MRHDSTEKIACKVVYYIVSFERNRKALKDREISEREEKSRNQFFEKQTRKSGPSRGFMLD
jgi:hypothetical protein